MKVADLIEDLETGDRSIEHLKKPVEPEHGLTPDQAELINRLNALPHHQVVGGFLGGIGQAQMGLQQAYNQNFANQQAFGQYASTNAGGNPWNR